MTTKLQDYCKDLEVDYSIQEIILFLQDGEALSLEGFTCQDEIEDVHSDYSDRDEA